MTELGIECKHRLELVGTGWEHVFGCHGRRDRDDFDHTEIEAEIIGEVDPVRAAIGNGRRQFDLDAPCMLRGRSAVWLPGSDANGRVRGRDVIPLYS